MVTINSFEKIMDNAAKKGEAASQRQKGDYTGPGGLLYCGKCHAPKQHRGTFGDPEKIVGCLCKCQAEQNREEQQAREQAFRSQLAQRRRKSLIANKLLLGCGFQGAAETEAITKCRSYAQALCRGEAGNLGLLLWGGVGSGKTFAAACTANYAIDNGVTAKITSLPRINGASIEERREFLDAMPGWGLLVLDDLGTERDTATANEIVFQVINTRYESRKPMIITTNLTDQQLLNPATQHQARIYDRVLEVCVPVFCGASSLRGGARQANLEHMKALLGE